MTYPQKLITEHLAAQRLTGRYDPRHIESFMRLQHSTLDHLSPGEWAREERIARECIDVGGTTEAESLARSEGL
mgnify:CR=1 FL=1